MALKKRQSPPSSGAEQRHRTRDRDGMLQQLQDEDPAQRRWAARDLADIATASPALLDRLAIETDLSVRESIFTSLAKLGDPQAVSGLAQCLASDDAQLRNEAIEVLKVLPAEVAPIMAELLHAENSDVRILAINVLESLRHPHVEAWLLEIIEHDPVLNVCGSALDLLSEVGTEASRGPLEHLKQRFASEPYIQFAAELALKRLDEA